MDRNKIGKTSGRVGIICNVILAIGKMIVGVLASSMSIVADSLNNLADAASSIVTLIGFKMAEKPADQEHPYGHARYEYLSGLMVAVMILVIGFELGKGSVEKILNPSDVEITVITAGVLLVSVGVKLWLYFFNKKMGNLIHSNTLLATAQDSLNDVITTSIVLTAAVAERILDWKIDGFMGLGVALFIVYSGIKLLRQTISPLLGEGANEELQEMLIDYIKSNPRVLGCHDLMVHDYGPGKRFASIHVEMDKDEDSLLCHEILDDMERECMESHGVHLVIHYDPVITNDPELNRMRHLVTTILKFKDERISIHDFRMVEKEGYTDLNFDIVLPLDMVGQEDGIRSSLETALNDLDEKIYHAVITFDLNQI